MQRELESAKKAVAEMSQSAHIKSSTRGGMKSLDETDEEQRAERELQLLSHVAELQKTMRPYQVC
jgi:hypothetical protein